MATNILAARIRSVFFWIHLSVGVTAGTIVLIMSLTGVLLGYERQLIAWLDGAPTVVAPEGAERLPLDTLLARAGLDRRDIASVVMKTNPSAPVMVRLRQAGQSPAALDPFTGTRLTTPQNGKTQAFMSWLRGWHRWLGVTTAQARPNARAITGAANLGFLFLCLSGLYLWWPRRWTPAAVRSTTLFATGLRGKPRDFNWHNVFGFWAAIPLAIVVASAVFMSYQWPGRLLDRYWGTPEEEAAARRPIPAPAPPSPPAAPAAAPTGPLTSFRPGDLSLTELAAAAAKSDPDWQSMTITMPTARDTTITFVLAAGNTYRPDLRTTVLLDPATAAPRAVRSYGSLSTSRKIRAWYRFGHTGEVFGLFGQTVATLASLGGVMLVWTGISLALRRFAAWRRRKAASPVPLPDAA